MIGSAIIFGNASCKNAMGSLPPDDLNLGNSFAVKKVRVCHGSACPINNTCAEHLVVINALM